MTLSIKILWSIYGWFFCNFAMFFWYKEKLDDENKKFTRRNLIDYKDKHWDNWVFSALFMVPTIMFGPDLHQVTMLLLNKMFSFEIDLPWQDWMYGTGTAVIEFFIYKTKEKLKKQRNNG